MIYSISQGFIFARGIKTASTSLADELAKKSRPLEKSIVYKLIRRIPRTEKIYPFYDFRNHPHTSLSKSKSIIPSQLFNSCIKFGVVREPVSWMMSGYKHWLRIHRHSEERTCQQKNQQSCFWQSESQNSNENALIFAGGCFRSQAS